MHNFKKSCRNPKILQNQEKPEKSQEKSWKILNTWEILRIFFVFLRFSSCMAKNIERIP